MEKIRAVSLALMSTFFFLAGIGHFIIPGFYLRMMPPYLPYPLALVFVSGVAESALGALALFPQFYRISRFGLIALLVAVFPANVQMALHPETFPEFSPAGLLIRLPIQVLLVLWVMYSLPPKWPVSSSKNKQQIAL